MFHCWCLYISVEPQHVLVHSCFRSPVFGVLCVLRCPRKLSTNSLSSWFSRADGFSVRSWTLHHSSSSIRTGVWAARSSRVSATIIILCSGGSSGRSEITRWRCVYVQRCLPDRLSGKPQLKKCSAWRLNNMFQQKEAPENSLKETEWQRFSSIDCCRSNIRVPLVCSCKVNTALSCFSSC